MAVTAALPGDATGDPTIVLEWRVTMEQLLREWREDLRRHRKLRRSHRIAGGLFIAFGLWQHSDGHWFLTVSCALYGLWCLLFPYPLFWLGCLVAWAYYRGAPIPPVWFKVELLENGARFHPWAPPGPPQLLNWSRLREFQHDEFGHRLSFAGDRWLLIPRSAFVTADAEEEFVRFIERHRRCASV